MVEIYEKLIKDLDDLTDIATALAETPEFKKSISKYLKSPYDADIERVNKGVFTLGISKGEAKESATNDSTLALSIASNEALTKLACTGARFLTTKNINDRVINALGLIKSKKNITQMLFDSKGDTIYLVGKVGEDNDYYINNNQTLDAILKTIESGLITSAHYISANGLFLSLLECSAPNQLGFDITGDAEIEDKDFLFSRSNHGVIITVNEEQENDLVDYMFNNNIPITLLGHVTRGELRMDDESFGDITDYLPE